MGKTVSAVTITSAPHYSESVSGLLGRFVIALFGGDDLPLLLQFFNDGRNLLAVQFGQLGDIPRTDRLALIFHGVQDLFFFGIHKSRTSSWGFFG